MTRVESALAAHHRACADRATAERQMGHEWRDAASRIVEQRFLEPLAQQDRDFARALAELDQHLRRALEMIR